MDLTPVLIVATVFGGIAAIILGPSWLKSRERRDVQATIRAAIDKGQPLPPEMIDAMTKEAVRNIPSRGRDLRRGVIWLAVGVGMVAFSTINALSWSGGDWSEDWSGPGGGMIGIAAIPITVGLAFIVLSFFNKNKD